MSETKDTNPKDAVGTRKWRQFSVIPMTVIWEIGVAMLEGARKYGRHNYREVGVRGSVYVDAAIGHISQWWEGEDLDPDTQLSHITQAITTLIVIRDSMIRGNFVDDRPPKADVAGIRENLQERVDDIFRRIPDAKDAYVDRTAPSSLHYYDARDRESIGEMLARNGPDAPPSARRK